MLFLFFERQNIMKIINMLVYQQLQYYLFSEEQTLFRLIEEKKSSLWAKACGIALPWVTK